MYDFSKLKPALIKFKHETALEYGKKRLTYGELSIRITALSNALSRMHAKTVAILLRNSPELILSAFAACKSGKNCVLADSKTVRVAAEKLVKKYAPEIVIMPKAECLRLEDIFIKNGCKTVIFSDGISNSDFPAAFELERLVSENDYRMDQDAQPEGRTSFFEDCLHSCAPDISMVGIRDKLYVDALMYESSGARAASEILYTGHRLCFESEISPTYFRKRKIQFVITDLPKRYSNFRCEIIDIKTIRDAARERIGQAVFCASELSLEFTKRLCMETRVSYTCEKIQITVKTDADAEISGLADKVSALCRELLYPFDAKIGLRAVKKT